MKYILVTSFAVFLFCFAKCNKEGIDFGNFLPQATQEGKNTLGFMLDGKVWKPKGFNGTAHLSIDMDFWYNNGIFGIAAYRITSSGRDHFVIGVRDSLNYHPAPFSLDLTNTGLYGIHFSNDTCSYFSSDSNTYVKGKLFVSKLDKVNGIVAGTFAATLYKPGCDSIKITDGRFDMKF